MDRKKRKFLGKEVVLGFDETNNGFGLKSHNPNYKSSLIMTGYLSEDIGRANYGTGKFESKNNCRFFGKRKSMKRVLERARNYLDRNPDFLYTSVSEEAKKSKPLTIIKAEAIAALTCQFFLFYDLECSRTRIILDEMDGKMPSEDVNYILELYLRKAGLQISHVSKRKADSRVISVRKADTVGYYISAIHFLGKNNKWPYRHKKVPFNRLDYLIIEANEMDEKSYEI